jgi:coiled-coil domain-containing protein 78
MDRRERRTAGDGVTPARMSQYVEEMLDDMKRAHRIREDQLSSAANSFKERLEQVVKQHEVLLAVYRSARVRVCLCMCLC